MRLYSIAIILLTFIFVSCNKHQGTYLNSREFTIDNFITVEKLNGRELELSNLVMRPIDILVNDSVLITIENSGDKLFHVYNLNTQSLINECIVMGQGPNDMIEPEFINCDGEVINIIDLSTSTAFRYDLQDFITNPIPKPINRVKLEEQVFVCAQQMGENFLGYSFGTDKRVNIFDKSGKKIDELIDYPVSEKKYTDMEKMDAFYMKFISNGTDKIAIFHYMTDLIEIYDNNGILQKRLHGPDQFLAHFKQKEGGPMGASPIKDMNRDAFVCPRDVDNSIFTLYNGAYIDSPEYTELCSNLLSFSWDGVPQIAYQLDSPIFSFAIDSKNKKIYGISNNPEFHIVEYSY